MFLSLSFFFPSPLSKTNKQTNKQMDHWTTLQPSNRRVNAQLNKGTQDMLYDCSLVYSDWPMLMTYQLLNIFKIPPLKAEWQSQL